MISEEVADVDDASSWKEDDQPVPVPLLPLSVSPPLSAALLELLVALDEDEAMADDDDDDCSGELQLLEATADEDRDTVDDGCGAELRLDDDGDALVQLDFSMTGGLPN